MRYNLCWTLLLVVCTCSSIAAAEWAPKTSALTTRWAKDVSPDNAHPEYPRPQMVREHWLNLNGLWDYAIVDRTAAQPAAWEGQILVPFPVESALSGVMKTVGPEKTLWYRRTFTIPAEVAWKDKNVLLHFGAVDWDTTVWVNGHEVVKHRGGYDPFSADITAHLKSGAANEIVVSVFDGSDDGYQPRGKQVRNPHGIWYTPTTGIWQTVWLEPVPKTYVRTVRFTTNRAEHSITAYVDIVNPQPDLVPHIRAEFGDASQGLSLEFGHVNPPKSPYEITVRLQPEDFVKAQWSPEAPQLWSTTVALRPIIQGAIRRGQIEAATVDQVQTYFAIRDISIGQDTLGVTRILFNGQPYFQYGPLDQGFWPDGLYTAPTDEALKYDIEMTKKYGFNMIRKHVKVEPARWYYWCDKLGLLVWQDMPSGDRNAPWNPVGGHDGTELTRSPESAENYRQEWQNIINAFRSFPCIVMWVPFNEAWGQFDTVAITKWTQEYDPTRIVNCASGGNDFPVGDVVDVHRYPGPFAPKPEEHRAAVLGEYGGLGLPLKGHTWQGEKNWGYRSFTTQEALTEAYLDLLDKLHPMIDRDGLSAAIYTQTTDVEIEVNGLMTYDRAIEKISVEVAAKAHAKLWQPAPTYTTLVPTSEQSAQQWRFTLQAPADNWFSVDFDTANWKAAAGGFGEPSTPGSQVHTEWKTDDIWLRREFTLTDLPQGELRVRMHHDEDAEVYLNGTLLKKVMGYTVDYQSYRVTSAGAKLLKPGRNVLAVHCHQTGGGQYIDVGLDTVSPAK